MTALDIVLILISLFCLTGIAVIRIKPTPKIRPLVVDAYGNLTDPFAAPLWEPNTRWSLR